MSTYRLTLVASLLYENRNMMYFAISKDNPSYITFDRLYKKYANQAIKLITGKRYLITCHSFLKHSNYKMNVSYVIRLNIVIQDNSIRFEIYNMLSSRT